MFSVCESWGKNVPNKDSNIQNHCPCGDIFYIKKIKQFDHCEKHNIRFTNLCHTLWVQLSGNYTYTCTDKKCKY